MAQAGYTPLLIYGSGTTGNTPSAGNLTSSSAGAELAINYFDGKLFYKDNAGVVQTLATKGTGSIGGSTTEVQYNNAGALAGSANLTFNGTTLTANALTVSTGNLTFSGTAQRILGDFSNATVANRLTFQTSTTNGNTVVGLIPNGTSLISNVNVYANSDPANTSFTQLGVSGSAGESFVAATRTGTGTYLPMTFYTGGSERVRVDTSGNVGIGTASPGERFNVNSTGAEYAIQWNSTGSNNWVLASATNRAYIANKSTPAEVLTILNGGNVGIGTASPGEKLTVSGTPNTKIAVIDTVGGAKAILQAQAGNLVVFGSENNVAAAIYTNNVERMRFDTSGNIVAGASAALATNATNGFLYVPTCAGTPTGTPTAITGMAPIVVNTTNNKLYFYSGGVWRDAGP
jgi:hypothetical protein